VSEKLVSVVGDLFGSRGFALEIHVPFACLAGEPGSATGAHRPKTPLLHHGYSNGVAIAQIARGGTQFRQSRAALSNG
jgi:hypothetical protein